MAKEFGEFVKIPAVHHVPGCERVAQVVKTEIFDSRLGQDGLEALIHFLALPFRARFPRENTFLPNCGAKLLELFCLQARARPPGSSRRAGGNRERPASFRAPSQPATQCNLILGAVCFRPARLLLPGGASSRELLAARRCR